MIQKIIGNRKYMFYFEMKIEIGFFKIILDLFYNNIFKIKNKKRSGLIVFFFMMKFWIGFQDLGKNRYWKIYMRNKKYIYLIWI